MSTCEDAPGPIDVECLAVVAELVDDWFRGGRAEPDLVLSPILQILTKLARPPVCPSSLTPEKKFPSLSAQ